MAQQWMIVKGTKVRETEKALLLKVGKVEGWVPKSQMGVERVEGTLLTVALPVWLANQKGFTAWSEAQQEEAPKAKSMVGYKVYEQDGYKAWYKAFSREYGTYRIAKMVNPQGAEITESHGRTVVGTERYFNHGSREKDVVAVIQGAIAWDKLSAADKAAKLAQYEADAQSMDLF